MSSNIFLAPCDSGNFDRTVLTEVDLSEYPDHPDALLGLDKVQFWGVRDGKSNRNYFDKMTTGDLVLFYQDEEYIGTGWIKSKFEDNDMWASKTFWKNAPSNLIYTLEDFTRISVPKKNVNRIFEYDEDHYPQGLSRVAENRIEKRPVVIRRALIKFTKKHSENA